MLYHQLQHIPGSWCPSYLEEKVRETFCKVLRMRKIPKLSKRPKVFLQVGNCCLVCGKDIFPKPGTMHKLASGAIHRDHIGLRSTDRGDHKELQKEKEISITLN